jgi:ISXO2 transposase-like protein
LQGKKGNHHQPKKATIRQSPRSASLKLGITHSAEEWVRFDPLAAAIAHTNTAESFNATLKRAIIGVWHWFSIKHTNRYLSEISFRWNHRKARAEARITELLRSRHGRLHWRECIA